MNFPEFLSDLGDLYEILATFAVVLIGRYQSQMFVFERVSRRFKLAKNNSQLNQVYQVYQAMDPS